MANITVSATIADFMDSADATAARTAIAAGTVATTESTLALLATPNSIIVNATGTDTQRGAALLAAYAAAKALTPNGSALSQANRAVVILPPGAYKLAATFYLDGNFVDIVAQFPQVGGSRRSDDTDDFLEDGGTPTTYYRPPATVIYRDDSAQESVVIQWATDVRLTGFGISHLGDPSLWIVAFGIPVAALMIGDAAHVVNNSASEYRMMYFWSRAVYFEDIGGVRGYWHFRGIWIDCIACSCSFRTGYGDTINFPAEVVFEATMKNCQAGPYSFLGDGVPGQTYTSRNSLLENCQVVGIHMDLNGPVSITNGFAGFSGCTATGVAITSTVSFIDCVSGANSFGVGTTVAGTFLRCQAGACSFGSTSNSTQFGIFSGKAEDCTAGPDSFGGRNSLSDASNASAYCSGILIRCTAEGSTRPINLSGAKIRDSRFTVTTTGQDCFKLLNSNSQITNSELIVLQGGTGRAINASSALNVVAVNLRLNNATNDADGLGSNVTNLVASAGNVVSNSIT